MICLTWKIQFQSLWNHLLFISLFVQIVMPVTLVRRRTICQQGLKEHLERDKKAHIFTHLVKNETCKALSTKNCFEIIESTSTPFRLKLKEVIHIIWKKQSLNKQQKHVSVSIAVSHLIYLTVTSILRFYFLLLPLVYYFLFEHLI